MCASRRTTTLVDDTPVDLRAVLQSARSGAGADDGSVAMLGLGLASLDAPALPASSLWEEEDGDSVGHGGNDSGNGDGNGDDDGDGFNDAEGGGEDDEDLVAFEDRLVFADALEHAWLHYQARHVAAIRAGLAQVRRGAWGVGLGARRGFRGCGGAAEASHACCGVGRVSAACWARAVLPKSGMWLSLLLTISCVFAACAWARGAWGQVIPVSALSLWTEFEVERLVCGRPTIDIDMLRRHTEYSGLTGEEPFVQYFWQVLHEFGQVRGRVCVSARARARMGSWSGDTVCVIRGPCLNVLSHQCCGHPPPHAHVPT
jgi:hypothetical protein